jgi:hypothetical protein
MREACLKRDLAERQRAGLDQRHGALDTAAHDIAMRRRAGRAAEQGLEMRRADAGDARERVEPQGHVEIGVDMREHRA